MRHPFDLLRIAPLASLALVNLAGCGQPAAPPEAIPTPPAVIRRDEPRPAMSPVVAPAPAVNASFDTERDRAFAEFVEQKSGGMVGEVAVGIERKGLLQVVLGRDASPDDTLPLVKSMVAGARKDFPDKAFTVAAFDPSRKPILKAHYEPGQGIRYELAGSDSASASGPASASTATRPATEPTAASRGLDDQDRRFQSWAMDKGKDFLRYVQADLRRSGRIWFGVTPAVKPADVPDLTKALLQGARAEFPGRELVATVFDPEGGRIGRATLANDGQVSWEK